MVGYDVWNSGAAPLLFRMVSTADGFTPMAGLSPLPTVLVSKAGAAPAATDGVVSELGGGWYKVVNPGSVGSAGWLYSLNDPTGPLLLLASATGATGWAIYHLTADDPKKATGRKVWGENVGDMGATYGEESAAMSFHNAFNWNKLAGGPSGVRLTSAGLDQVAVESGVNVRQALAVMAAVLVGRASGLATSTATFYAMGASGTTGTNTARVVATVDTSGNRSGVTPTLPS